ncbi:MAG TPA: M28 family peptidase, partial [Blastocatellia bacterium]|nr:M28 family peptidase [Blastocatellia bacterium]
MAETETKTLAGKAAILRALSFLLFILIACLSIYSQRPPRAIPASAPVTEFSSSRAMNHVRVIASQVHPIGSPAHKRVRDYLLSELSGAGLQPQVQTATVLSPRERPPFLGGTVNNVVARLNGSRGGKAILLMAHYDSAPNSFGASDDGSGVAAILETLRTIKAGPPLKNDVIVLFTDG